jgi:hypothetical protein
MVEQLSSQKISIWLSMPHFTTADPLTGSVCLEAGSVTATSLNLYLKGTDEKTGRFPPGTYPFTQKRVLIQPCGMFSGVTHPGH